MYVRYVRLQEDRTPLKLDKNIRKINGSTITHTNIKTACNMYLEPNRLTLGLFFVCERTYVAHDARHR